MLQRHVDEQEARAEAQRDAVMFAEAATALSQIAQSMPDISDEPTIKSAALLRRLLPDRARFAALDEEVQGRFRRCMEEALKKGIARDINSLWEKLHPLWSTDGPLMKPHHAKKVPRLVAAEFCRALSTAIQRDLDDTMQQEAA